MPCTHLKLYQYKSNKGAYKKCVVGKILGKGGLNAKAAIVKAERREFIECDIRKSPFSRPCVIDIDVVSVSQRILADLKDYIARCEECNILWRIF